MANTQFLMQDKSQQKLRIVQKRQMILDWLKTENFSSCEILSTVIGLKGQGAHNTLKAMVRDDLLRAESLATGSKMQIIYGLSPNGSVVAADFKVDDIGNYFEPGRVSPWTLQHSLSLQKLRLQLEAAGWTDWKTERECRREGQASGWLKMPDALSLNAQGERIALEVERSYKTLKRYPDVIAAYLQMAKQNKFEKVQYWCTGQVQAEKMQAIFQSIKEIKIKGQVVPLQDHHHQMFHFFNF